MEFSQAKQSDKSSAEREGLLKEMAEAYDGYMILKANLEEGTKVILTISSSDFPL